MTSSATVAGPDAGTVSLGCEVALEAAPPAAGREPQARVRAGRGSHPDSGAARLRHLFPARQPPPTWPTSQRDLPDVLDLVDAVVSAGSSTEVAQQRRRAARAVLGWLAGHPGDSWQQRWLASGAQSLTGSRWRDLPGAWLTRTRIHLAVPRVDTGLLALVCVDVIRPDPGWMLTRPSPRLTAAIARTRDPDGFARLRTTAAANPAAAPLLVRLALNRVATILACKGGHVADVAVGDVVELLDLQSQVQAKGGNCKTYVYQLLLDAGVLPAHAPPTVRAFRGATGQRSLEALVDRHHLACRPVRDLILDYLRERQPALDYTSLEDLAFKLAGLFWAEGSRVSWRPVYPAVW